MRFLGLGFGVQGFWGRHRHAADRPGLVVVDVEKVGQVGLYTAEPLAGFRVEGLGLRVVLD